MPVQRAEEVEVNVADLTGDTLDWAVAKSLELIPQIVHGRGSVRAPGFAQSLTRGYQFYVLRSTYIKWMNKCEGAPFSPAVHIWCPSIDWNQGGVLLEPEGIQLMNDPTCTRGECQAVMRKVPFSTGYGPTYLIAAMRCYVMSQLGDKIKVPKELVQ